MTFEELIRKSIKQYFEKSDDFDEMESSKDKKYNKKYFDSVKAEMITKKDVITDKLKKAK